MLLEEIRRKWRDAESNLLIGKLGHHSFWAYTYKDFMSQGRTTCQQMLSTLSSNEYVDIFAKFAIKMPNIYFFSKTTAFSIPEKELQCGMRTED